MTARMSNNNVFFDESKGGWSIEPELKAFGEKFGKLIAVFVTKDNARNGKISERWCFSDSNLGDYDGGEDYQVVRYVSHVSFAGGIAPVCAISTKKGKIKFLKDIHSEDTSFDRPLVVQYMRVSNV